MSQRNVRKLLGAATIPPPNESSDEEYEPLYTKNANKSTYEGLVVSSSSESEHEAVPSPEESAPEDKKENQKRKKKKIKKKSTTDDLDEIDKSLLEVNALLGEPSQPPAVDPEPEPDVSQAVFATKYKHLNVVYELNRIFGRDSDEENKKRRGRKPNLKRIQSNTLIKKEYNFKKGGLSMSIDRREDGLTFFKFDHSREYQRHHMEFLMKLLQMHLITEVEDALKHMHVEGLLEAIDMMFRVDDNSGANTLVEHLIAYMQHVAHPSFNITDIRNRLEYKFPENRPFHIILLKYLHLLTNRACHRTSLEIAKLLLNLDPCDPLAVVFIIDTVALRAREHQWLIEAIEYLDKERDVLFLFNIKFSYALAHFHVATKKKAKPDLTLCDELLKKAMIAFPWTVKEILEASKTFSEENLRNHEFFDEYASATTSKHLKELTHLHVAFAGSWWNEQPVREWLLRNGTELVEKYDNDPALKEEVKRMEQVRNTLFRGMPTEVLRHLSVIKYMADLLIDREIPNVEQTYSFDPHPARDSVNRYSYATPLNTAYLQLNLDSALITNFFASLNPNFEVPSPEELHALYFSGPTLNQLRNAINVIDEIDDEDSEDEESEDEESDDGDAAESYEEDGDIEDSEDDDEEAEESQEEEEEEEEEDEEDEDEEDEDEDSDGDESANESEDEKSNKNSCNRIDEPEEVWTD
ncbi:transcription factor 25 [Vanessa atalanta]|uniref:transcription factor 25 n=1 Tax=Vanessa atalanta TaxID=42275 RepID=UPI001FCDD66B|nr:transcription factor 25 [Vanessa atalanta]